MSAARAPGVSRGIAARFTWTEPKSSLEIVAGGEKIAQTPHLLLGGSREDHARELHEGWPQEHVGRGGRSDEAWATFVLLLSTTLLNNV